MREIVISGCMMAIIDNKWQRISTHKYIQKVWFYLVSHQALGNLGYQDFHQRTLSASSSATARLTCFIAAPLFIVLGLPSVLIGAAAASTGA